VSQPAIHSRFVQLDEVRLHYAAIENDHPPMVMLHGIGMDWAVWQAVSRRLAPFFRLLMLDLRGHGQSDKPARGYSLADYAADVEQLIALLGLSDVTLVGSSLGGMVAAVVEEAREFVSARILVDPPLMRGSGPRRLILERILTIKRTGVSNAEQRTAIFEALTIDREGAGNVFTRYMADSWLRTSVGVIVEALEPIETLDQIDAALAAIDCPTLIMRGNPDRGSVLAPDEAERAQKLMKCGDVLYFPESGHAIHGSEPVRFVNAIVDFRSRWVEART